LQAERDWKRAQKLGPSDALSQSAFDAYQAGYETAKANVTVGEAAIVQARAALDRAQRNLSYTVIKSPVNGVIIDRRVNVGQTVVSSLNAPSLFLIAQDLRRMEVWVSVNEADIGRISPGQPVVFTVDAFPDEQFHGTVRKIRLNASMTQNVVTYTEFGKGDHSGTVWILEAGSPKPVSVKRLGSDGISTEVESAALSEGTRVIVGEEIEPAAATPAGTNPFAPTMPRGGGRRS
jgi:multidrug efflux pump subunit AcrA (membrane-fusion protein)